MNNQTKNETLAGTNISIKDLSFVALFALIFGSMMGSGVFDIPQNIAYGAGIIAVSIGWLITAIGVIALSWAFIYLTNKRPDIQSGIYGYAKHGFGDYVGFNSAWGYALNALLANTSYLIYIFATLGNFAIFHFFGKGNTVQALLAESVLIWAVYAIIRRGIREAAVINIIISSIKILALIAVIALFVVGFHWTQLKANLHFEAHLGSVFDQVKSTMLVTVWDFTGIEAACIFALRAKNIRDVAKATLVGAIVVCVIDAAISLLPFGVLSSEEIRHMSTPSTAGILTAVYGAMSGHCIRIAVVISVLGALLAWTLLATNIFYVAAEDKTLPKLCMRCNKVGVPEGSLLICSVMTQLFVVFAYYTNALYLAMIQLATSLILLPYLLSTLFAMKLIIKDKRIDWLSCMKGVLAVLYGIWLVYSGGMKYLALSCLLYLSGAVFYFLARREQHKSLFDSKWETLLFVILIVVTLGSISDWLWA